MIKFLLFFLFLSFVNALNVDQGWVRAAVIVTSEEGLDGLDKPLNYAKADGEKLLGVLRQVGQVDEELSFWIHENSSTSLRKQIAKVRQKIFDQKGDRSLFLQIYYSGHGSGSHFHIGNEKIPFEELKKALGAEDAEARMYVLDVCFGASFFEAKGFKKVEPIKLGTELGEWTRGEVVISSSALDEQAFEVKDFQGSVFTTHWLMALRGAADQNKDGQVSLFEAYNYTYDQTVKFTSETLNRPQHPSYQLDFTGARDLILSRPLETHSGLFFNHLEPGIYSLADAGRGVHLGEIRLSQKAPYTLALAPGVYEISKAAEEGGRYVQLASIENKVYQVNPQKFTLKKSNPQSGKGSLSESRKEELNPAKMRPLFGIEINYGLHKYTDAFLEKNMSDPFPIDTIYGTKKEIKSNESVSFPGIGFFLSVFNDFSLTFNLGMQKLNYEITGAGAEQFMGTSARFPVQYKEEGTIRWMRYALGVDYDFFEYQNLCMSSGISYGLLALKYSGEATWYSVLFDQTSEPFTFSEESNGSLYEFNLRLRYRQPVTENFMIEFLAGGLYGQYTVDRPIELIENENWDERLQRTFVSKGSEAYWQIFVGLRGTFL